MATQIEFTQVEIDEAQAALNLYPSGVGFWDSFRAQDILEVIVTLKLVPTITESEVRDAYNALRDEIEREEDDGPAYVHDIHGRDAEIAREHDESFF